MLAMEFMSHAVLNPMVVRPSAISTNFEEEEEKE